MLLPCSYDEYSSCAPSPSLHLAFSWLLWLGVRGVLFFLLSFFFFFFGGGSERRGRGDIHNYCWCEVVKDHTVQVQEPLTDVVQVFYHYNSTHGDQKHASSVQLFAGAFSAFFSCLVLSFEMPYLYPLACYRQVP